MLSETEIISASVPTDPPKCGIYFLILNKKVMYVGQSIDIGARLLAHRRAGKVFERWHWTPCPAENLDDLERAYLDEMLPPWNYDWETTKKSGKPRRHYGEEIEYPAASSLINAFDDWPASSPEELAEAAAIAEEEYQARRGRMLRVRAMRKTDDITKSDCIYSDSEKPMKAD